MAEVLILAFALSMDAFAVSIGLGAKEKSKYTLLAFKSGLFFGFFQMIMPLIGYLGGRSLFGWIESYAHIIAFCLLALIGVKMVYESFAGEIDDKIIATTNRILFTLAIATSIDALAAGFSLALLDFNAYLACALIGLVTFVLSWIGVFIGKNSGTFLESKAELFGGIILLLLAVKFLLL